MTVTFVRKEPVEKLSIIQRKDIRDEFDAKKAEIEKEISDILGQPWTIEVDFKNLAAYLKGSSYEDRPGSVALWYMEAAPFQLKNGLLYDFKDMGKQELNTVVTKHVLRLDVDDAAEDDNYDYCGPRIKDGALCISFNDSRVASNVESGLNKKALAKELSKAPTTGALPFAVRAGIARDYDPEIEEHRNDIAKALIVPDLKLNGNFEQVYNALASAEAAGNGPSRRDWKDVLGNAALAYFESMAFRIGAKIARDDIMKEEYIDVVNKNEIVLRVVNKLKYGDYCESTFADGRHYIDFTPKTFFSNIDEAGNKIIDGLSA